AGAELQAELRVRDSRFWPAVARGTVGLAERWMEDAWDCNDMVALARMFVRELPAFDRVRRLLVPAQRAARLIPRNTRPGARRNEAGLADRVTVLLEDYRELTGRFDKLVSIEMIEAVGWQYFDLFFRRCSELLRPDGAMLLQAIVIDDAAFEAEKASKSFTNT